METSLQDRLWSIAEYFEFEHTRPEKNEYRGGRVVPGGGGTADHSIITVNFISEIGNRLDRTSFFPLGSDLRIGIPDANYCVYANGCIMKGRAQPYPGDPHCETFINPCVIIEVFSPATEAYDRGEKFHAYQKLASLQEYVLVDQQNPRVEIFRRLSNTTWQYTSVFGLSGFVPLKTVQVEIPLSEIYSGVEFPPEPSDPQTGPA